jgi:predicted DNA-binding transcriptional regulator
MGFLFDQMRLLGLNDREVRVFTTLSTLGRMKMSKISSSSGISRTTVDAVVRRLVTQGLISKVRIGGHYEYVVTLDEVAERLRLLGHKLRPETEVQHTPQNGVVKKIHRKVEAPSNHEGVHADIEKIFVSHAGDRATLLLSTATSDNERKSRFEHCINYARASHIILTVLTTTDVSKSLSHYAQEILALLTAYDVQIVFLPPSFCFEHIDVLSFRDIVLTLNQTTNELETTDEVHTVLVINHLLRVAKEVGWHIDMRIWLENMLKNKAN